MKQGIASQKNYKKFVYQNNIDFLNRTQKFPKIVKLGFIRSSVGIMHNDWLLNNKKSIAETILRAIPILGNILGAAKLYSIFSAPNPGESKVDIVCHTFAGILETLGLGLVILVLKILFTCIWLSINRCKKQPDFVSQHPSPIYF
ncbi:hypothetical protein [Chlamydia vaughanii]|uniref:hypothetical protein n=1 Tax=Chlamydia vaughanii TaxID=3112552 RepID=UPI0032B10D97